MIHAELFDCGTKLVKRPYSGVSGMELGYYRELDMEHRFPSERTDEIQREILSVDKRVPLSPWPVDMPGNLWIDWHKAYYGDPGGPKVKLWHYDFWSDTSSPVPSSVSQTKDPTPPPWPQFGGVNESVDPVDRRSGRDLTPEEIQTRQQASGDDRNWVRLPLINESGPPQLQGPVVVKQGGHLGTAFLPSVNYGSCFQGVDLTKSTEWYRFVNDDGDPISDEEGMERSYLRDESYYRLYLAPAKWRMGVTCRAHYWYISYTESYGVPLDFFSAWFTRPSVYPERHDVNHTKDQAAIDWLGTDYAYDAGVDSAFDRSRGSLDLAHQIIDAQWWTLSEAFVFVMNDPALIALWQYPPDPGDIVLGIGRVDTGGNETRHWVVQRKDVTHVWPREVIGLFIVPWTVA